MGQDADRAQADFEDIKKETGIKNEFFIGFIFQNAFSMDPKGF